MAGRGRFFLRSQRAGVTGFTGPGRFAGGVCAGSQRTAAFPAQAIFPSLPRFSGPESRALFRDLSRCISGFCAAFAALDVVRGGGKRRSAARAYPGGPSLSCELLSVGALAGGAAGFAAFFVVGAEFFGALRAVGPAADGKGVLLMALNAAFF